MTPAGTSNELDVQNGWEENTHIINDCSEEDYPPIMPLPIPPDYVKRLARSVEMAEKGMLPPSYNMVLNKYLPIPEHQSPVLSQHQEISSCSKSLSCTEPESLGDDQIESESLGAPAYGRKRSSWKSRSYHSPRRVRSSEHNFWRKRARWCPSVNIWR